MIKIIRTIFVGVVLVSVTSNVAFALVLSKPVVNTPTYVLVNTTTVILGANVASKGSPAIISARGICYGALPAPTTNCTAAAGVTTGVFTLTVSGLTKGITYYYRGYARNTTGTGYSVDGTFMIPNVAFLQVFSNGQVGTVVVPAGVTEVTFTGNGANAGGAGATTAGAMARGGVLGSCGWAAGGAGTWGSGGAGGSVSASLVGGAGGAGFVNGGAGIGGWGGGGGVGGGRGAGGSSGPYAGAGGQAAGVYSNDKGKWLVILGGGGGNGAGGCGSGTSGGGGGGGGYGGGGGGAGNPSVGGGSASGGGGGSFKDPAVAIVGASMTIPTSASGFSLTVGGGGTLTISWMSPPAGCTYTGPLSWGAGCSANSTWNAASGGTATISNTAAGYAGSEVYSCSNGVWGGPTSVSCTPISNGASCGAITTPASVVVGQMFPASVAMTNTGNTTWTPAALYRLGSQSPQDNSRWGMNRIGLPGSVLPGASVVISGSNFVAPVTPGTYAFDWKMVQDGVAWFGPVCAKSVVVTAAATTGTISVSSNIPSSWTITGPATIPGSGTSQTSASQPAGTYTITWGAVSGYTTPSSQSFTLVAGNTIAFTGAYSVIPCANGATNPPTCTSFPACANGANNSPSCTQCPSNQAYYLSTCVSCTNGGCTGGGGSASNPTGTLTCTNGATNPLFCNSCPASQTFVGGSCVNNCTNGATNPPACTTCTAPQTLVAGVCTSPATTCGNSVCETGETFALCPADCPMTVQAF